MIIVLVLAQFARSLPLFGDNRTCEANHIHVGMCREVRAKVVVSAQSLKDARREEACPKLDQLHAGVRGERGRLQYEGIPGQQGGTNLSTREKDGIVPGDDASNHTKRRIVGGNLALRRVLEDLLRKRQAAAASKELNAGGNLVPGPQQLVREVRSGSQGASGWLLTGFPCSVLSIWANSSACDSKASAKPSTAFFRSSQGTSVHCFAAFWAAATALWTSSAVLRGSGGFSSRVEGLTVCLVWAVPSNFPSMIL